VTSTMRILQLITRPQRRGAEIFALELAGELARRGHDTRIAALYVSIEGRELPLRAGDLRFDADGNAATERVPGVQPALLRRLLEVIDDFAPDVVQVNGSRTVKYGSVARRLRRRAPWALVYRSIGTPGDWTGSRLRTALYRRLVISAVDAVVAVSATTLDSLHRCYDLRVPATVLPRAVPPAPTDVGHRRAQLRRELDTPPEAAVLLFAGRLSREKRPDRLLRATAQASELLQAEGRPVPHLWIAGAGPLYDEIERDASSLPLPVHLLGDRDDVLELMAAADLLLLTSDTEGLPGVVLEAGSVGLPAVATRVGGVAECIVDGETGRVVDVEDEAGLAEVVAGLLADTLRRRRYGEAARRLVAERFSLTAVTEGYLELYRHAMARRPGGAA